MAPVRAWVLNFDAEDELDHPSGYTTPRAVRERFGAVAARLGGLLPDGDAVLGLATGSLAGMQGVCWCPTPRALRALRDARAVVPAAPPPGVLRTVNGRGFCAALGQGLPGGVYARTEVEVEQALSGGPAGVWWVLKRQLSYAGRGRRRVRAGALTEADRTWVRASLGAGGLQAEPWVERLIDAALHGFVAHDGRTWFGEATVQSVDERGQWVASRRAADADLSDAERAALRSEAERVARALHTQGYFGPFGIDAFRWRDARGDVWFNPRCEVNARYSMGWAVGMGALRPDLDAGIGAGVASPA